MIDLQNIIEEDIIKNFSDYSLSPYSTKLDFSPKLSEGTFITNFELDD
jgi:hypothetical protein